MVFALKRRARWSISFAFVAAALVGFEATAQQTTNTNCNTTGSTTNCTSTTNDVGVQQQKAYEQGREVGNAIGEGLAGAMQGHAFTKGLKKYCDAHPGETWTYHSGADGHEVSSGHCPDDEDKALAAANIFMAKHRDYKPNPANSKAVMAYLEAHQLDPRDEKSYERAYKDLKKDHQLLLYSR